MKPLHGKEAEVAARTWRNLAITRLAMASRLVVDADPVSVMLIGSPGGGKTEILEALVDEDRYRLQTDVTQVGLCTAFEDARDTGLLGLVIPDFGTVANKGFSVAQRAVTWLAAAMAEGVGRIDRGGDKWVDYGGAQLGIYTAMTMRDFDMQLNLLESNAFLTRTIVVKHKFSRHEDRVVRDLIRRGYLSLHQRWWGAQYRPGEVTISDRYESVIEPYVDLVYRRNRAVYAAQRTYNVFETLLKASARLRDDHKVNQYDVDYLARFATVWSDPPFIPVARATQGA